MVKTRLKAIQFDSKYVNVYDIETEVNECIRKIENVGGCVVNIFANNVEREWQGNENNMLVYTVVYTFEK